LLLKSFPHRVSITCRSGNVRDILDYYGYCFNESLVFGISSPLYFSFVLPKEAEENVDFTLFTGTNHNGFETLGIHMGLHYASWVRDSREQAWDHIASLLEEGHPVLLDVILSVYLNQLETVKYQGMIEEDNVSKKEERFVTYSESFFDELSTQLGTHVALLIGMDQSKNEAYVIENSLTRMQTIPLDKLQQAMDPKGSTLMHVRNRYGVYFIPDKLPSLSAVIKNAIRANVHAMIYESRKQHGVKGLHTFAQRLPQLRDLLSPTELYNTLHMMFYMSEIASGGGLYRRLYAHFLREASGIVQDERLLDASKAYMRIARNWRKLTRTLINGINQSDQVLTSPETVQLCQSIAEQECEVLYKLEEISNQW
jgi:hypothetical protein